MKMTMVLDLEIEAGELAQRLAHQPRLKTGQGIAHLAFEFGFGRQRRNRIDHDDVDAARAHQRVGDFKRLFAGVRLGDQHFVDIDAQLLGIDRIERVFGVDIGGDAALLLGFGHGMQRQRRLARGIPGRKFRSRGRAAGRRCPARCPGPAIRSKPCRYPAPDRGCPSFITEPLPNARSIWQSAASSARFRSPSSRPTTCNAACAICASSPYFTGLPAPQ